MNYRILLFISILLLTGYGTRYTHFELPNNHISFPAEGESVEYATDYGLFLLNLLNIEIEGREQQTTPLYIDSKIVGECSEWINFIDGYRIGEKGFIR